MKIIINCFLLIAITLSIPFGAISQNDKLTNVEYKVVAEGTDSPLKNFQVVCYNKYFNQEQLPVDFQIKYNLTDKILFKKKMLIEIFHSDTKNKGLDKIDFISIKESKNELFIAYNVVNSDKSNDNKPLAPFLIVQIPKSKKTIRFIVDGVELGKAKNLYILN